MELLHPAMWHVALESWQWIHQVAAPCSVQCDTWLWDDMSWNSPKRPPYWNSTSGFDFDHINAVDVSFCTSLRNFIQIGPHSAEQNDVMSIFKMADLCHLGFFMGPIIGSLKSPCTTSYRSSIETIALKCLVYAKIAFLQFGDRQTDIQTNRRTDGYTPVVWSRSRCRERRLNNTSNIGVTLLGGRSGSVVIPPFDRSHIRVPIRLPSQLLYRFQNNAIYWSIARSPRISLNSPLQLLIQTVLVRSY